MAYTTIDKSDEYFNTVTYTASGPGQSVTGVNFQPDLVWLKRRSAIGNHYLVDSVRGVQKSIFSNDTAAESSDNYVTSFNSDGFSLGADNYTSPSTLVGWNWLAGGTAVSNTDGSITSSVSANTTSGFSIVSYTGNGTAGATVGHGLGSAPKVIFVKNRIDVCNWMCYHAGIASNAETYYIELNTTSAAASYSGAWNNTAPNSNVFTVGNDNNSNGSGNSMIAYCFAEKKGFSKFGSYTGNGSADGTFIYTGFKPAFMMFKRTDSAVDWTMYDNKRIGYNPNNYKLRPNLSNAEYSTAGFFEADIVSNGFKIRTSDAEVNTSSGTYIYMAFAENPLVTSGGTPTTAR